MRVRSPGMALLLAAFIALPMVIPLTAVLHSIAPAHAQEDDDEMEQADEEDEDGAVAALVGRLSHDGEPVEGVEIVALQGGEEVGSATTDADGEWRIEVPRAGPYVVRLEQETLPEGIDLRDEERAEAQVQVLEGRDRTVLFPLGEVEAAGFRILRQLPQVVLNGVKLGLIIGMAAIGLSLIYGTTRLINFAHGEFVALGAIAAWVFNTGRVADLHLILAAAIAVLIAAGLGGLMERGLFRPLRARQVGLFQLLVITIGLSLVIRHLLLMYYGGRTRRYAQYALQERIDLGIAAITPRDLAIIVLSIILLAGVGVLLQRTRIGKAMRAVADNVDLAESSGIDVRRVILIIWIAGGGLAAVGGVFLGATEGVNYFMGFRLLLLMFAGVILGGIGTAYGALVGSLVVGIVTEVSTLFFASELKIMWALLILIVVLLVKPTGILGTRERIG